MARCKLDGSRASVGRDTTKRKPTHRNTVPHLCLWLETAESASKFTACVIYLPSFLCFCPGGDTCSQNGGEDVTSRQHDRGWRHGPPRTPEWRFIPGEPEETLRPQWDLRKPPFLCLAATASIWLSFIQAAAELYSVVWESCVHLCLQRLPKITSQWLEFICYCSYIPLLVLFLAREPHKPAYHKSHYQGMMRMPLNYACNPEVRDSWLVS